MTAQKPESDKPQAADRRLQLKLSEALQAALERTAEQNDETVADLCRRAIANECGVPELAGVKRRGRPITDAFPLPPIGLTPEETARYEEVQERLSEEIIRAGYTSRFICQAVGKGWQRRIEFRIWDPTGRTNKTQAVAQIAADDFVSLNVNTVFKKLMEGT